MFNPLYSLTGSLTTPKSIFPECKYSNVSGVGTLVTLTFTFGYNL